jgi:hypothetical protein
MVLLSDDFSLAEFEKDSAIPVACLPILKRLCQEILQPIRTKFGPLVITSGYRPPLANAEAHGVSNSEHVYTPTWAAADFVSAEPATPMRVIFDWMRGPECASMPFHQLILEAGSNGSSVIHVSINVRMPGVRSVLTGATHNAEPYVAADHVAYQPSISA